MTYKVIQVCEEWFSRMRGLLMRTAAAADSPHLTLAHATARFATLQQQLAALRKVRDTAVEEQAAAEALAQEAAAEALAISTRRRTELEVTTPGKLIYCISHQL